MLYPPDIYYNDLSIIPHPLLRLYHPPLTPMLYPYIPPPYDTSPPGYLL